MAPADPTYPFLPIAGLLAAVMLLLVLLTSFVRQSWNLGVVFLCFWLFLDNIVVSTNAIVWSDNSDIKYYTYCDIATHVQTITNVVRPMATLIIIRRLYLITSLRSVELPDKAAKRRNRAIEWTMGLIIPLVVAGPLYYVIQLYRFAVLEGFGCTSIVESSVVGILLQWSWSVMSPLLSITIYYPRVIRILYLQRRDMHEFLQSNNSVSRFNYFRIFALASIDILLTLPIGVVNIVLLVTGELSYWGTFPIYEGWTTIHSGWGPIAISGSQVSRIQMYFSRWTSPVLSFAIFGLFGATKEARASYWLTFRTVGGWFGWKPTLRTRRTARSPLGTMEFGGRAQEPSIDLEIGSRPSFIDQGVRAKEESGALKRKLTDCGVELRTDVEKTEGSIHELRA
ncbi:unnamed protein product [Peniophora sp. CBMAI 1063]|nr:unnamed protein product [Peniophora sp. CBMAI 1063]